MRVLRASAYSVDGVHVTTVTPEDALTDTLESACWRMMQDGLLVVTDIFEVDDGMPIEEITVEAVQRMAERGDLERHMALSYHWNASKLQTVSAAGFLGNPGRAPIPADDYRVVLEQLARHPNYEHQMVVVHSLDDVVLMMRDGEITERSA
jgi:hypothetical protein